eukprot:s2136_g15.t1
MAQARTTLADVWDLLRATKQQDLAPVLISHGVRSVEDIESLSETIVASGVAQWKMELLTVAKHRKEPSSRGRWDLPVVRQTKRASFQAALDAALPNNRRRCVEALERDVLANTTKPSMDSKVKTYQAICVAWRVAWPISLHSVQCFGASLKEGAYKSSQGFFQAIFIYQRRYLQQDVDPVVRSAARDYTRSIARGLGPSVLKDCFDVSRLADIPIEYQISPFDMQAVAHGRDVLLLASWFMLRELELANCKWSHIYIEKSNINVMLPVQKNDTAGSLTMRSLRCACRIRIHPLCPVHAAKRHLERVQAHHEFRFQADFPVVPNESGEIATKYYMVQFFRRTIEAAGVALTRPNNEGSNVSPAMCAECRGPSGCPVWACPYIRYSCWGDGVRLQSSGMCNWPHSCIQIEHSGAALLDPQTVDPGHVAQKDIMVDDQQRASRGDGPCGSIDVEALTATIDVDAQAKDERAEPSVSQADLEDLRNQLSSLRQVMHEPAQVLVHRSKSHIVHVGATCEAQTELFAIGFQRLPKVLPGSGSPRSLRV